VLPPGIHVPGLSADPSSEVVTSRRPAQVAAVLHRALQQRLARGLSDPRLQGLVSILDVHVTPDLSHARVRVSVLDSVHLRRVPELSFELAVPREETPE
jgi:ribosome-binding factor A